VIIPILAAAMIAGQPQVGVPPVFVGALNDGMPFNGGPYEGLGVGMVSTPDGKSFRGLLPSKPEASSVASKNQAAVAAFIAGHANPTIQPLSAYLSKKPSLYMCKQQGAACQTEPLTFGEPVTANTPFALDDGKVRVEWLYGSALYYISWLTLKGGKITAARTQPAWMPLQIRNPN
jgi:hypothetical protein